VNRDGATIPTGKKRRTGKRHAYVEKVWSLGAWKDVGEFLYFIRPLISLDVAYMHYPYDSALTNLSFSAYTRL
jgi:hypothetical protein